MERAAFYVRLSKEDENKVNRYDNSESIQNQINLLSDYANRNEMETEGIYIDDDYSGLYEDRPEFERLIANAKLGKFTIVLCKTQSRFTRNVQHSEKYLEELFPLLGIRFIGVVDGVDTDVYANKKTRQINGLVNDWYVEDLSNNIRAVFNRKMKEGQNLAAFPTFGYIKDPKDKHKLIIDDQAAEVVRYIYNLSLNGLGVSRIADKLSQEKISTPVQYKKEQGFHYATPNSKYTQKGIWSTTTIKRILNNETYIGWLMQGREKKISYKSKKIIITPREEWIIVKDHHESIISEEVFYKVQKLLKTRRKSCKISPNHLINNKNYKPHVFSGKIICKDCKSIMTKTSGRLAHGHDYFLCQLAKKSKLTECTRHSIRYDYLEQYVAKEIHKIIYTCLENKENVEEIKSHIKIYSEINNKIDKNLNLIIKNSKEITDNEKALSNLYLDKVKGVLSECEYIELKKTFSENNQLLKDKNQTIDRKNEQYELELVRGKNLDFLVNKYADFDKLTFELVNDFISLIEIGETQHNEIKKEEMQINETKMNESENVEMRGHESTEENTQEIVIHWNF
ncbi:recombinase family protein [[Clostridium] fimetarium]|uniref:Site-specific DNA recombinase n=1 Tax=[Clostridium] fimetarium TaxID=99656 RepID=A0A1I0RCM0_9FIRM|nr:recombinase family protein [[Clostridium] fimetarium]SEW37978.1 Site-specific DNA recombinase [[Clostridium] fimetarium]